MTMFAIARYLPNGDLDPSFNGAGKVITEFSEGRSTASGLAIDDEDRIILAGSVRTDDGLQLALTRHLPDGRLDSTFGGDGRVRVEFSEGRSGATAVTIDGEKRIVAVGAVDAGGGNEFAAIRLFANGQLDSSFGDGGRSRVAFEAGHGFALAVSVDPSDRIVAAGFVNAGVPGSVFALVRYLEDGSLDRGFGDEGRVLVQFQGADTAFAVVHDGRGRIVAAGKAGPGGTSDAAIARLRPSGSLDVTFGVNGRAYSDLGGSRAAARAVALTPEDRIVLAGLAHRNLNQFGIARLLAGGDHDQTFSSDGRALSGFFDTEGAQCMTIDPSGRVVAAGYTGTPGEGTVFATARLLADGRADGTFGLNGQVFTNFVEGSIDQASGIGIDSHSRIVVGGTVGHPRDWTIGHGRFHAGERLVKALPVNSSFGVADRVKAIVYYPATREGLDAPFAVGAPFPIAGFVHANRGAPPCPGTPMDKSDDYRQLATILRHLARWGYVVISSDASESAPGFFGRQDILEASVRYLMAENGRAGSPFKDQIRTTGVSLMGHSTGGSAALALAHTGALDVAAVAVLVPGDRFRAADIPKLVIDVSEDDGTFGGDGTNVYNAGGPPKHLVRITGANHFGFTEELCFESDGNATISRNDQQRIALAYITAFLERYVRGENSHAATLDGSREIETLDSFGIEVRAET